MNGFGIDDNAVWEQLPAWQARGFDLHSVYIGGTDAARRQALWVESENADRSSGTTTSTPASIGDRRRHLRIA